MPVKFRLELSAIDLGLATVTAAPEVLFKVTPAPKVKVPAEVPRPWK